jgi:Flp pilus assembly protein TadG
MMKQRFHRLRTDERGMAFVFVGLSLTALLAGTMLAIDVGMLMTARTQAQRAADAGALAGATALVFDDFDNRSATGPAVTSAVNTAQANSVIKEAPSVNPTDVNFPFNPVTGRNDLVEVTVYRTSARANPLSTLIASIFGIDTADIAATATATAAPAGAAICVLPFTIPDKWNEQQTGTWDPTDTFDMYATQGNSQNSGAALANPDIYIPPWETGATGYSPKTDRGVRLVLKNNNQNKVAPSMYNAWDLPGSVGGDDYSENISTCNTNIIALGHNMTPENGNMVGPTQHGTDGLIAQDPSARWDEGCNCVKGSAYRQSPRIRIVPLYNPVMYAEGQQSGKSQPVLQVVNYLGVFVEEVTGGGDVTGRITPITGRFVPGAPPPVGGFAQAIMLVQ